MVANFIPMQMTVTLNPEGGEIPDTDGWTVDENRASATKTVWFDSTYGTLPVPTRTGYGFIGWTMSGCCDHNMCCTDLGGCDICTEQIASSTTVTETSNHTLHAHWEAISYKYTFNFNFTSATKTQAGVTTSPTVVINTYYGQTLAEMITANTTLTMATGMPQDMSLAELINEGINFADAKFLGWAEAGTQSNADTNGVPKAYAHPDPTNLTSSPENDFYAFNGTETVTGNKTFYACYYQLMPYANSSVRIIQTPEDLIRMSKALASGSYADTSSKVFYVTNDIELDGTYTFWDFTKTNITNKFP